MLSLGGGPVHQGMPRSPVSGGHTIFLVVAQVARGLLRSVDQALSASLCVMVAATEAVEGGRFRLGQKGIFLLKWTSGVGGGVKRSRFEF